MRVLDYEIPEKLHYSKEHEWIRLEGKEAIVGITDYAQKQLHEIVYVEVQKEGTEVKQFQTMGTVESVKSVSDIFSPITGRIAEINTGLSESPELLNKDPYGKGWLAKVDITDLEKDMAKLLTPQQYAEYIRSLEE